MALTDSDSKVMGAVSVLADLVHVNVLFILTSLPVVTAGAAMSAAHGVLLEVVNNEGGGRTRSFFRHFRRSFVVATVGWLLLLAPGSWPNWVVAFAAIGFALLFYLIDLLIAGVLRRITAPAAG